MRIENIFYLEDIMREIKFRVWDNDEKIIKKVESINFPLGGESSSKTVCI